ncbi:MAG: hypothetical protein COB79_03135 [Zetaproteobacteria bacterium]|nr:MAG: hypothetical protein COB79_03135 [Zetaproteobacteria bacterium]
MIIQAFGITDTGLRRKANEDSILVNETENIFLVADGLGGHGAGNVASAVAVDAIEGFGILSLASIGPILTVLLTGQWVQYKVRRKHRIMDQQAQDKQIEGEAA